MIDELVRHVRRTIPKTCHDTKLSKNGCQIALTGIGANRVIVDMDCNDLGIAKDQSRCDYIFIGEGNWVVPMELKRGNVQADEVTKQLRAGAAFCGADRPAWDRHQLPSGCCLWGQAPQESVGSSQAERSQDTVPKQDV